MHRALQRINDEAAHVDGMVEAFGKNQAEHVVTNGRVWFDGYKEGLKRAALLVRRMRGRQ